MKRERWSELIKVNQELEHPNKDLTRATGLKLRLKMKGLMQYCESHSRVIIKQKSMRKQVVSRVKEVGEMIFMDISSFKYMN